MNQFQRERKIKLLKANITEKDIARLLNVSIQAVNAEMAGKWKSERIRQVLCKVTHTSERKLFPEHFDRK